jgi:hypothetical protein
MTSSFQREYTSALLAGPQTNWLEAQEPEYKRQEEARKLLGQQLKERDDQWLKVKEKESLVNRLGELAEYSKSIGSFVQATQANKDAKEKAEKLQFEVDYNTNISGKSQDVVSKLFRNKQIWQQDTKNLKIDYANFSKVVNDSPLTKAEKEFLLNNHGGNALAIQSMLGGQLTNNLPSLWQQHVNTEEFNQEKWDRLSADAKKGKFLNFAYQEYGKLNFNASMIANNYQEALGRWVDTKTNLETLEYNQFKLSVEEQTWDEKLNGHLQNDNISEATEYVNNWMVGLGENIPWEQKKHSLKIKLKRLARSRKLTPAEQLQLKEGILSIPIPNIGDVGKKGEGLLSLADWNEIADASKQSAINFIATDKTEQTNKLNQVYVSVRDGTFKGTKNDLEEIVRNVVAHHPTLADSDIVKNLNGINPILQTDQQRANETKFWSPYLTGQKQGSTFLLDDKTINNVTSGKVNDQLSDLKTAELAFNDAVGLPTTDSGANTAIANKMLSSPNVKLANLAGFKPDAAAGSPQRLTGNAGHVQQSMLDAFNFSMALGRQKYPNNPINARREGENLYEGHLKANGFYVTDDGVSEGIGKYSATVEGKYNQIGRFENVVGEKGQGINQYTNRLWDRDLIDGGKKVTQGLPNNHNLGSSRFDERHLNTSGAVISNNDLDSLFTEVVPGNTIDALNQQQLKEVKDSNNIQWSTELLYKSFYFKKSPAIVAYKALDAFIKSKAPEDIAYRNSFGGDAYWKNKLTLLKNSPEYKNAVKISDLIAKSDDEKLKEAFQLINSGKATNNVIQRFILGLEGLY